MSDPSMHLLVAGFKAPEPSWKYGACTQRLLSGVRLITWLSDPEIVALALRYRPHAFMLSFGDPRYDGATIRATGCKLICQMQDLDSARLASYAVAPIPVVVAGGITDRRSLAAALMLGAHGALVGTRFCASTEALGHREAVGSIQRVESASSLVAQISARAQEQLRGAAQRLA